MGDRRVVGTWLVAAAVAVTVLGTAPASAGAASAGDGRITVTPAGVAPGEEVELRLGICTGEQAVGASRAFVANAHFAPATEGGGLVAEARVKTSTTPGTYEVQAACTDSQGKGVGTIKVVAPGRPKPGRPGQHESAGPAPSPVAPVKAGGGGTADRAEELGRVVTPEVSGAAALADRQVGPGGPGVRDGLIGLGLAAAAGIAVVGRLRVRGPGGSGRRRDG